jgi:hypothetical protein
MALVPCWTLAMAAHDDKRTRARWQAPGRTTITSRVGSAAGPCRCPATAASSSALSATVTDALKLGVG